MRVHSGAPVGPAPPVTSGSGSAASRRPRSFTTVLGERVGQAPSPTAQPPPPVKPTSPPGHKPARGPAAPPRVDTLLAAAARGKTFSPAELLALQSTVFNYSQTIEVVSRATDKLVGAVKQTMGTQV
jgi:hypothetical protein